MDYEAWNRNVVAAIGLFGIAMCAVLISLGIVELKSWLSKRSSKKRSARRTPVRKLRSPKITGLRQ
jgi:hypothetical protein